MIIYSKAGVQIADIDVTDQSYRYRKIMGENSMTLYFSSFVEGSDRAFDFIEIPVGSYVDFQGERYTLTRPSNFKKNHTKDYDYTLVLHGCQAVLGKLKLRNSVDKRLKFTLTAKPVEFIQMLVDNLNTRDSGWTVGACLDSTQKTVSFNHNFLDASLQMIAEAFETEWEITSEKAINLRKVEYNKTTPLALSYGKGHGFKPGVGRSNFDNSKAIELLYIQGGEKNIIISSYGSPTLLLPKSKSIWYDGTTFSYVGSQSMREYRSSADGCSLQRNDKALSTNEEDSLDCSDLYPSRVGTVSFVSAENAATNLFEISDSLIPEALDFNACLIEGEKMTIIFQSGMLAGREFDVSYINAYKRFEIVPATLDGVMMPGGDNPVSNPTYMPAIGDTYAVFGISLPPAYVCDDTTHTGASWDMFREAAKYLFENEDPRFSFTGDMDGIWSKTDWLNIGGKIVLGGYSLYSDTQFLPNGQLIRMIGIKDYLNDPYSPEIELSNVTVGGTVSSELDKRAADEVTTDSNIKKTISYTKRGFKAAQETASMLQKAFDDFSPAINPITVQTMSLILGTEALQFRYVSSKTTPLTVSDGITYSDGTKILTCPVKIIQHRTLGITSISPTHAANEFKYWDMPLFSSPVLDQTTKSYYIYAKCSTTTQTGAYVLSESAIKFDSVAGYYHLLVGILTSEYDGARTFSTMYGYAEALPGQFTANKFVSEDGTSFFDALNKAMRLGDKFMYNVNNDGQLVIDGSIMQHTSVKDDGDNISVIALDRGPFTLAKNPFFPGNITTFEGAAYYCDVQTVAGIIPTNTAYFHPYSEKGEGGQSSTFGYITNENNPVSADSEGVVSDYSKANGQFKIFKGEEDVTPYSTFKAIANGCEGTIKESQTLFHDWTDGVVQGNFDTSTNWQELSGLTAAYKAGNEKYLWVLSDSPANMIAAVKKSDASNQGVWSLTGVTFFPLSDWEDVESSVVNGVPYLYVFDYGNNPNNVNSRGVGVDMVIHRILEPTITGSNGSTAEYISIQCVFPAANLPTHRDSEGSIIDPVTGDIYIITKREAIPGVYKLVHQDNYTGIQTLTYMGKMWDIPDVTVAALGATLCNVVDATINKAGTELIVKNYNDMYLFLRDPATQTIYDALTGTPTIIAGYIGGGSASPATSHPSAEPQGEGICFDEMGLHLYSHSEYATGSAPGRFPLFKYSRINAPTQILSGQDGVSGYAGTKDTYIWDWYPDTAYGTEATFVADNADSSEINRRKGLLKFDMTGLPVGAIVVGSRLDLNIVAEGQGYLMYKMLIPWTELSTYNSLGGGILPDGVKASITPDCINGINLDGYLGQIRNNVPISTIQEWVTNPDKNFGWMFDAADSATGDGVQFSSREDAVIANRPKLTIRYIIPSDLAGFYKVTSIPTSVDDGKLKLTGTFEDISVEKVFSVSKSKVGATGAAAFKSIVFLRFETGTPSTPTVGSYASPVPTGWSDGVPSGAYRLWMSTRIFTSDGQSPQQDIWTTPVIATSTAGISIKYSPLSPPLGNPDTESGWVDTPTSLSIWMAIRITTDGVDGSWALSKIKGETGATGMAGPALVGRGAWDASIADYKGSTTTVDVVSTGEVGAYVWYRAKATAGTIPANTNPDTNTTYWEDFGAVFQSIATGSLFAEGANVAGFQYNNQVMESQDLDANNLPNLSLNGKTGQIRAKIGEIGTLHLIGNSLTADSMEFSEEPVETLASLLTALSVSITDTGGTWAAAATGSAVTADSAPLVLTVPSILKFYSKLRTDGASPAWDITIFDVSGNIVYINDGQVFTGEQIFLTTITLPAGSYTLSAFAFSQGYNRAEIYGFESVGTIIANASEKRTKIGNNGFYSFWETLKYFYYSAIDGLKYRGAIDIPGGLGGGSAAAGGAGSGYWGKFPPTGCGGAATKTITHAIGDTAYNIIVTPTSNNTYYVTGRTATQIQVVTAGSFDFIFVRTA